MIGKLISKNFTNPYVSKVKDLTGIVFDQDNISTLIKSISLPIILDIGCGNGEYLTDVASRYPDHFYIGFELQYKEVYRTGLKIQKAGLKNCAVASMDAKNIPSLFKQNSLAGAFILFPDPWPKTKQKKNRLVQKSYLTELSLKIKKEGFLKIRTDNDDYFLHMLRVLYDDKIRALWEPKEFSRDYHNTPYCKGEYITPFERIFLREGRLINYILLKRS